MKRFLALALTCLLAACGTQQRPADEPDFSTDPNTPVESPEPRLGEIESLISQAKLEIKRRDYDEARVKLHQVFRRDRWNPEANTIYQDLQISRGMLLIAVTVAALATTRPTCTTTRRAASGR